jgi:hypothetical protein
MVVLTLMVVLKRKALPNVGCVDVDGCMDVDGCLDVDASVDYDG